MKSLEELESEIATLRELKNGYREDYLKMKDDLDTVTREREGLKTQLTLLITAMRTQIDEAERLLHVLAAE